MQSKEVSPTQRAAIVIEVLREQETMAQIASKYGVNPKTLYGWKKEFLENAPKLFGGDERKKSLEKEKEVEALYQQIGQLQVEVNWLKKNLLQLDRDERLDLIDRDNVDISIVRQCDLVSVSRSVFYYAPVPESIENPHLMRLIDEKYTETPFYGRRRMTLALAAVVGFEVNEKRVARLMKKMGIEAIYPKINTSKAHPDHKKYPYLLGDLEIDSPNQVWSIDITYVRLEKGFAYLVAMIDWYSRKILAWRLSNTLTTEPCIEVLEEALQYGKPDIVNSDQGCQFTSEKWVQALSILDISISMDGRGRAYDNIFIERFWRTIKYEDIYPRKYQNMIEARDGISRYMDFYNEKRLHMALNYRSPNQVHGKPKRDTFIKNEKGEKLAA